MSELKYIAALWSYYTLRRELARNEDGSFAGEWILITAILATLALTAGAIVVGKVTGKAESIPMD